MTAARITLTGAGLAPGSDPILDGECPVVVGGGQLAAQRRRETVARALRELPPEEWAPAIRDVALATGGHNRLARLIEDLEEGRAR